MLVYIIRYLMREHIINLALIHAFLIYFFLYNYTDVCKFVICVFPPSTCSTVMKIHSKLYWIICSLFWRNKLMRKNRWEEKVRIDLLVGLVGTFCLSGHDISRGQIITYKALVGTFSCIELYTLCQNINSNCL